MAVKTDFNILFDRSHTNAEKYTLRKKLFGTKNIIPMWVADMDIKTGDFIIDDIKKRLDHPILGYEEFPDSAKNAQIKWMKENHNFKIKKNWIIHSPSVVTSINIAIQAYTQEEDEIIIQPPVYFPFFKCVKNNNRKLITNPLKKDKKGIYRFDFEDLKSKVTTKTKLLILCSPHNPVGRVWGKKELKALAQFCIKHNIKIFSDEIHCDLVYKTYKHIPFASINKKTQDITITALGVGKTFNLAGINTSTVVISNKILKEQFIKTADKFHLTQGNSLGHIAFTSAYKKGQQYRDDLMKYLDLNITKLQKTLRMHNNKISFIKPQGTYLVWLDCSNMNLSDKELRSFFIEKAKLGLGSGTIFGKDGSKHMRINIAVPEKVMDKALRQLNKALRELK